MYKLYSHLYMIISASISQFRSNIALYLERVVSGASVLIQDEKKGAPVAKILPVATFDSQIYDQVIHKYAGSITQESHPEWSSADSIQDWLHASRLSDEREI